MNNLLINERELNFFCFCFSLRYLLLWCFFFIFAVFVLEQYYYENVIYLLLLKTKVNDCSNMNKRGRFSVISYLTSI